VLGSFRPIPGAPNALVGFVSRNLETVLEGTDKFNRMKPVTASIMLDPEDDTMWDVRKNEQGSFLVRSGTEDLNVLLASVTTRDMNLPRVAEMASCSAPGEFLSFVCSTSGTLRHGFVLASDGETLQVITPDEEVAVVTTEDTVVEAMLLHGGDKEVAASLGIDASKFDSRSPAAMSEYYKQVYGFAPGYVAEIQAQIDAHAAV
jgi:hypothetical protein